METCFPAASPPSLVALDFESTGAVPGHADAPWQLGLVAFDLRSDRPPLLRDHLLHIPAGRPFNPYAPGRHAQLRPQLDAAPAFHDLWPSLSPLLARGQILVAHNASTERRFLARLAPLTPFPAWIDTLVLARAAFPALPSHALADVAAAADLLPALDALLPGRTWHDALYDALAAALFLRWLAAQPAWAGLTLPALVRLSAAQPSK